MRRTFLLSLALILLAGRLSAGTVRYLDGSREDGNVVTDGRSLAIVKADKSSVRIDLAHVFEVALRSSPHSATILGPGVLLNSGSLIAEPKLDLREEPALTFGREKLTVPMTSIIGFVFAPTPRSRVFGGAAARTGAFLRNGDFFPGAFRGIRDKRIVMNSPILGPQAFLPGTIAAALIRELPPLQGRLIAVTVWGSQFMVNDLQFNGPEVSLQDPVAGRITIKIEELASIHISPGLYLSLLDEKPARVDPPLGVKPEAAVQIPPPAEPAGSASGPIVSVVNATITYNVPAGFRVFVCQVEVPKEATQKTPVMFAVYGDGRPIFRTPPVAPGDKPAPLRVDLGNVRSVSLRVEPSGLVKEGFGHWLSPILLR
jgi:hypothetical protein